MKKLSVEPGLEDRKETNKHQKIGPDPVSVEKNTQDNDRKTK